MGFGSHIVKVIPNNDQVYIEHTLRGDQQAFAVLVDRYKDMVYTLALRMTGSREEAEEAAQDTFLKVYRSLARFKGDAKFSTWIYRIGYNACLDKLKQQKRRIESLTMDDLSEIDMRDLNDAENVLDRMQKEERREAVLEMLDLLEPQDRFILTLCYFEELSLAEAAEIMGINRNNAKVRLHRSRMRLAAVLKNRCREKELRYYEG